MSKRETRSHRSMEGQVEDLSNGAEVDPLEDLDGAEELLKTDFTAGNHVKIVLAGIAVLVVVFLAVVVKWMRHGGDASAKPTEEAVAKREVTKALPEKEPASRQERSGFPSAGGSAPPTVVAAMPGPNSATKPKSPAWGSDTWTFTSDSRSGSGKSKEEKRPSAASSFRPRMTLSTEADRSAGSAGTKTASATDGWQNDPDRGLPANSPRPADPFRNRSSVARGLRDGPGAASTIPSAPGSLAGRERTGADSGGLALNPPASRTTFGPPSPNPLRARDPVAGGTSEGASGLATAGASAAGAESRFTMPGTDASRRPEATAPGRSSPTLVRNDPQGSSYVVQSNDNYWSISERLFGTGAYFQALAKHNAKKFPREDKLQTGDVIFAPSAAELERLYPELCPSPARRELTENRTPAATVPARSGSKVYIAREGDNVVDIARQELGKASRWTEIYELNKTAFDKQSLDVAAGTQLLLPDDGPAMSQRTEPGSRR